MCVLGLFFVCFGFLFYCLLNPMFYFDSHQTLRQLLQLLDVNYCQEAVCRSGVCDLLGLTDVSNTVHKGGFDQ